MNQEVTPYRDTFTWSMIDGDSISKRRSKVGWIDVVIRVFLCVNFWMMLKLRRSG